MAEQSIQIIFMLGGPGSGKGTQSELLCSQRNMAHLSVGDLLREEIGKPGTSYGPIIEENMRNGRVGPKEITVALLKDAMFKSDTEPSSRLQFVIDGFPRKMDQAQYFEETIAVPLAVVLLDCPEDVMKERLMLRAGPGRSDDDEVTIEKRMDTFRTTTSIVLEHYNRQNKLICIDACGTKEVVSARLLTAVDELTARSCQS